MRITTHNTPTGTDETYSSTLDTSDDQDESDDDLIKKRPAIHFSETVFRGDFFSNDLVRVSPQRSQTKTEKRKTTRRGAVADESDWYTEASSSFDYPHFDYCYVPEYHVRTYRLTRLYQSGTWLLTRWLA